ncbi:MAG: 23S rRNA (pseudouridine(1915)-N(3))-methyltransferase RlmH [Alphaproteobacteria bacterium]|nr:23S rRNA (pseudouridine(1915)-N(3))-methyltransferase RlmH [Alphaproteobacteria bacterium]QQS56425.1 MAG: 23S rRNA (pseudouridine(1915)-N(3))-methyltransferase RlmH [Alphaproteobacteria bacterium]
MFKIEIIAVARIKKGPYADLAEEYSKRIRWPLDIREIDARHTSPAQGQAEEELKILKSLKPDAIKIALDERGETLSSTQFAKILGGYRDEGAGTLQFIIGGADGLTSQIRIQTQKQISFGRQTWPHLLARIMLLEQIYRAQQILSGHPYHRE